MSLAPLAAAPAVIQLHITAALAALAAGLVVMLMTKGTLRHRRVGWVFVAALGATALSSVFITGSGHFSAIHLLTLLTVVSLPYAVLMRRRGNIPAHRQAMLGLFAGLAIAGAFTLVPGRLMHQAVIGNAAPPR